MKKNKFSSHAWLPYLTPNGVTHLTMLLTDNKHPIKSCRKKLWILNTLPHRPQKSNKTISHICRISPLPTVTKMFFCKQIVEFFTKKTTRYHSDTIPISFRRNTNPKMYPIFRQILRRHLSLSPKNMQPVADYNQPPQQGCNT